MTNVVELLAQSQLAVLGVRMALVAVFVVVVALVAERLGAFLGAMVASLPLYTGPVYLMLALERDAEWFAEATLGSLAICGITPVFVLAYCVLARRHGVATSLGGAALVWILCAYGVQLNRWSLGEALLFVAPIYAVAVTLARGFTRGIALPKTERRLGDLVLRAALVAGLSGLTIWVAAYVPAQVAGVLSVAPILTTSLILVLHPRMGGPPTAALMAHTLSGLVGMVLAFALLHLIVRDVGVFPALGAALVVTLTWNLSLVGLSRLRGPAAPSAAPAPVVDAARPIPPPLPVAATVPPPLPPPVMPPRRR